MGLGGMMLGGRISRYLITRELCALLAHMAVGPSELLCPRGFWRISITIVRLDSQWKQRVARMFGWGEVGGLGLGIPHKMQCFLFVSCAAYSG